MDSAFRIGEWLIEPDLNLATGPSGPVKLQPRLMEVLVYLADQCGKVVTKEELVRDVWEGAFVTDEALTYTISELRKALGDDAKEPRLIQTIPKKGYRLISEVTWEGEGASVPAAVPERPRWQTWVGGAAISALVVAVGLWVHMTREAPGPPPKTIPLTSYPGEEWEPALSPDGSLVAFTRIGEAGTTDLYVKQIDGGEPLAISSGLGDVYTPAWSPDGQRIAFIRHVDADEDAPADGVYLIPALGGAERQVGVFRSPQHGLSWSPDGQILALSHRETSKVPSSISIYLLSLETGERRKLTAPPPRVYGGDATPRFSPDGATVAFDRGIAGESDIYLVSVESGDERRLTFGNYMTEGLDWTQNGASIVFSSARPGRVGRFGLWRVSASGGEPEPLGVGEQGVSPSLSRQGRRLAYVRLDFNWNIWRVAVPSAGQGTKTPERFIAATGRDFQPHYSPDGTRILFSSTRSGYAEIWVCDRDGTNPRQLTFLEHPMTFEGSWSPDGKQIAFLSLKEGSADIYIVSATGGIARRLTTETWDEDNPSWSRDGRSIYFFSDRTGPSEIWRMPAEGGQAEQITKNGGTQSFESANGTYLYFAKQTLDVGPPGIWRMPIDGGEEELILEKVRFGDWTPTGKGIYFVNREAEPGPTIELFEFATGEVSHVAVLEDPPVNFWLSVSPDEQWILYARAEDESDIMLVENFR